MIVLHAGTLVTQAKLTADGEVIKKGMTWSIYGSPDAKGKRKSLSYYSGARKLDIFLLKGDYLVEVTSGKQKVREEFSIVEGKETRLTIIFNK